MCKKIPKFRKRPLQHVVEGYVYILNINYVEERFKKTLRKMKTIWITFKF